jgi:hypothetical protein
MPLEGIINFDVDCIFISKKIRDNRYNFSDSSNSTGNCYMILGCIEKVRKWSKANFSFFQSQILRDGKRRIQGLIHNTNKFSATSMYCKIPGITKTYFEELSGKNRLQILNIHNQQSVKFTVNEFIMIDEACLGTRFPQFISTHNIKTFYNIDLYTIFTIYRKSNIHSLVDTDWKLLNPMYEVKPTQCLISDGQGKNIEIFPEGISCTYKKKINDFIIEFKTYLN